MRLLTLTVLFSMAHLARADCLPLAGDRILALDMARAVPAFARIPPETMLGYAPSPGARRTYGGAELTRLAQRYGITAEPGLEACFIRPMETLTRERVAAALQPGMPAAHLEVLDFSHQPAPPGDLRFDPCPTGVGDELFCRGVIRRSGQADFPVWAKVRVQVSATRAIAVETLPRGVRIAPSQLRAEPYDGPPGQPSPAEVAGRVPRRSIPAGTAVESRWLSDPADVLSGERVDVEVRSGQARILLEGRAQSSGQRGQMIAVRNPANGTVFRATVCDRGRVAVVTGGAAGPTGEVR